MNEEVCNVVKELIEDLEDEIKSVKNDKILIKQDAERVDALKRILDAFKGDNKNE